MKHRATLTPINPRGAKLLRASFARAMVAMMASQELLAESDPLIEDGPVYEGVGLAIFDYLEFWDLEGLQTWAEIWAAKA